MGERAVALCRSSERYWRYHSQWGGAQGCLHAVLSEGWDAVDRLVSCDWIFRGSQSPSACLETLDYLTIRAVYVLTPEEIRVGVPVWLGVPTLTDDETVPPWVGVVVAPETVTDLSRLTAQVRWLKELLGRALEDGALSLPAAIRLLLQSLSPAQIRVPDTVRSYLQEVDNRTSGV